MTTTEIISNSFVDLSLLYAKQYKDNPRVFINCFLKFDSVKSCCLEIVKSYKKSGVFEECLQSGQDFTGYANKLKIGERWKRVLAEVLLIIYSLVK